MSKLNFENTTILESMMTINENHKREKESNKPGSTERIVIDDRRLKPKVVERETALRFL